MGGNSDLKLKQKTQFPSPSSQLWLVATPLASANISITAESCIGRTGLNPRETASLELHLDIRIHYTGNPWVSICFDAPQMAWDI